MMWAGMMIMTKKMTQEAFNELEAIGLNICLDEKMKVVRVQDSFQRFLLSLKCQNLTHIMM